MSISDFNKNPHSGGALKILGSFKGTLPYMKDSLGEILFFDIAGNARNGILVLICEKSSSVQYIPTTWDNPERKWGNIINYNFSNLEGEFRKAFNASSLNNNEKDVFFEKTIHRIKEEFFNHTFRHNENNIALFTENGKYGVTDNAGTPIITPKYDLLRQLDLPIMKGFLFESGPMSGVLDSDGNIRFESDCKISAFKEHTIFIEKNGKKGLSSLETGKISVYPEYDFLSENLDGHYDVHKGNKSGVINSKGEVVQKLKLSLVLILSKLIK